MIDEIKKKLLSEDFQVRRGAIEELNPADVDDELLKTIIKLIEDDNQGVRDAVSHLLINASNEIICSEVVPYISSPNISVRNLAGEILLKKGVKAIPPMLDYLKKANDDDQKFIIDVLGLIGENRLRMTLSAC